MPKFIKDATTGKDNLTTDAARLVGIIGAAFYIVFWAAAVFHLAGATFGATDAAAYGAGLGTVLLSMAGAIKIKATEEPSGQQILDISSNATR